MSKDLVAAPRTIASASESVQEYSISVLKGAIGAIPYLGTMLNEVLFEARSRLKQKRMNG